VVKSDGLADIAKSQPFLLRIGEGLSAFLARRLDVGLVTLLSDLNLGSQFRFGVRRHEAEAYAPAAGERIASVDAETSGIIFVMGNLQEVLETAARDEVASHAREDFCILLATALRDGGQALWIGGSMFGPDRVEGDSPFSFGSDATVGLATVMQIAGELTSGAAVLLRDGNRYGAAALIRQLVEVEYLAWAFAEDEQEAERWMRSDKAERRQFWQPMRIRERSEGRFRGVDYASHCGRGGHPSPEGINLLPDHQAPDASPAFWWCDLAIHGHSVWRYALLAAGKLGNEGSLLAIEREGDLAGAEGRWRTVDPFIEICRRLTPPKGGLVGTIEELRRKRIAGEAEDRAVR
jgi:hypothetical protein